MGRAALHQNISVPSLRGQGQEELDDLSHLAFHSQQLCKKLSPGDLQAAQVHFVHDQTFLLFVSLRYNSIMRKNFSEELLSSPQLPLSHIKESNPTTLELKLLTSCVVRRAAEKCYA